MVGRKKKTFFFYFFDYLAGAMQIRLTKDRLTEKIKQKFINMSIMHIWESSVMSSSKGWLELGVCITSEQRMINFVEKWQDKGKRFYIPKATNHLKVNIKGKLRHKICLWRFISVPSLHLLHGHKSSLREETYGSPNFSELSAFSQIRETLRKHFSAYVESHLLLAQNNL